MLERVPGQPLGPSPEQREDLELARLQANYTTASDAWMKKIRQMREHWGSVMYNDDAKNNLSPEQKAEYNTDNNEQFRLWEDESTARKELEAYQRHVEPHPPQTDDRLELDPNVFPLDESPSEAPPRHESEPATPQERLARLKIENPRIQEYIFDEMYAYGATGNSAAAAAYIEYYASGPDIAAKLHEAVVLGQTSTAETQHIPTEAPPAAPEVTETYAPSERTPHETTMPITEPILTETALAAEQPQSTEEREKLAVTLDELKNILISQLEGPATINNLELQEDAGKLQLRAELNAGLLGGEISIRGIIVNRGNEIAVDALAIQARGYVKTRIENNLSRFFPTIKTHFENKYRKSISSIQIVNYGLEITFETSPNATPEPPVVERQPIVAGGETQYSVPEARAAQEKFARMLDKEPDEDKKRVLQEAFDTGPRDDWQRRNELAREHPDMENAILAAHNYGMLAAGIELNQHARLDLERWEEAGRAERMEGTLLSNLDEARSEYARLLVAAEKQAKNRPREHRDVGEGQPPMRINLLREDLTNTGDLADAEKKYRAALTALRAHDGQLLQKNPEHLTPKKLQKEVKRQFLESTLREADILYNEKIDASIAEHPRVRRMAREVAQAYHQGPTAAKILLSSGIFGIASWLDLKLLLIQNSPLLTTAEEPTGAQNAIIGMLVAKAGQSMTKGYQKTKARAETRKAMTREAKTHHGDLLAGLLATDNERLNDLALAQAGRKSDEKTKRRIAAAVGSAVGYMTSMLLLG